ncbi:hypothetical protein ACS0TY_018412 [Phlomoides rotata]
MVLRQEAVTLATADGLDTTGDSGTRQNRGGGRPPRSIFASLMMTARFSEYRKNPDFLPHEEHQYENQKLVKEMLGYNVPGGKLNRGLSVIDSYKLLKEGKDLTENEVFLASVLNGWSSKPLQDR